VHVTLTRDPDDLAIVRNMFTAYFYDMSQYDDGLAINCYGLPTWIASGLPGPRTQEECAAHNWWIRGAAWPHVIRADGNPAGFTIILPHERHGGPTYLPPEIDYEVLDFWIAPKYRRQGVGRQAAWLAFDTYRGTWLVIELARNTPARAFWHGVIADYTAGRYDSLEGGTQQRFRN
jgi:predicted acetyltransferase